MRKEDDGRRKGEGRHIGAGAGGEEQKPAVSERSSEDLSALPLAVYLSNLFAITSDSSPIVTTAEQVTQQANPWEGATRLPPLPSFSPPPPLASEQLLPSFSPQSDRPISSLHSSQLLPTPCTTNYLP